MKRAVFTALSALAAFGVATFAREPGAAANPLDTFGFGSRPTAMAGAVSADVSDPSANYYNPAGLARAESFQIALGYFRADHTLRTNGVDNHVDPVKGLTGGLVAPGKILGIPFAFGLGVHLPDDRLSRVRALRQEQPRWELYDNRNQRLYLAANLALSPFHWLQIGGGVSFMSATEGRLDITGTANIFRPEDSQLRHEVDADLTAVRYPQAGARIALSDKAAIAVVYRGEFRLDLDLKARLLGDISQLTTAYYALEAHSVDAFLPQQVVLGGSWDVFPNLKAGIDFTWINWSAYVSPVAQLGVKLDIPPPQGGWPPGISPPTTPAPTRVVPIKMHDRVVPHIGLEWRALKRGDFEGFVRGGFERADTPIVSQHGSTNYIDRDRTSYSAGLGLKWRPPIRELPEEIRLDVHGQLSELSDGVTEKDSAADLVGDYTAGGHIVNLGATLTVGF